MPPHRQEESLLFSKKVLVRGMHVSATESHSLKQLVSLRHGVLLLILREKGKGGRETGQKERATQQLGVDSSK